MWDHSLHKKWSFLLAISSVNATKSARNCGFGHMYWRNLYWKASFFFAVIPNGGLTGESFYWNLCYNKFVKITCKSTEFTTKTSTTATQKLSVNPRSKRTSSTKLQTLSSLTRNPPKIQSSTLPIHCIVPVALIKTFSWNKFVIEKECGNCGKQELRYKNNRKNVREESLLLTIDVICTQPYIRPYFKIFALRI